MNTSSRLKIRPVAMTPEFEKELGGGVIPPRIRRKSRRMISEEAPVVSRRGQRPGKDEDDDHVVNIINHYLQEISQHNLLTPDEEQELARRARRGDKEAKDLLIRSNLRLVVKMAKKYIGRGVSFLDLVQEGNKGLMMAVEKFDPERGFRFTTYASWWIKQSLVRAIANHSRTIRVPVHMNETISRIQKVVTDLRRKLGRQPEVEEIAEAASLPVEKVEMAIEASKDTISMDSTAGVKDDESQPRLNQFITNDKSPQPEEIIGRKMLKEKIEDMVMSLPEKERIVLIKRFGLFDEETRTLEEIGNEFGVTRERIRQIEAKALKQLRHPSRSRQLIDFIDDSLA